MLVFQKVVRNASFSENSAYLLNGWSLIKWFESYLSSRESFVSVNDIFSEAGNLNCGVPQESILGSLLFFHSLFWYTSIIFPNHYQKMALTFMLVMPFFSIKTKIFTKLPMFSLKRLQHSTRFVDNKLSVHFGEDKTKWIC